jgi:DNA-directed RNA polymerase specialized sigma24 family protein
LAERFSAGFSAKEISHVLGRTTGAIKSRIKKLQLKLKYTKEG